MNEKEWLDKPFIIKIRRVLNEPEETKYGRVTSYEYHIIYSTEEALEKEIEMVKNMPNTKEVSEVGRITNGEHLRTTLDLL